MEEGGAGQLPGGQQRVARLAHVDDAVLHHGLRVVHVLDAALLARRLRDATLTSNALPCLVTSGSPRISRRQPNPRFLFTGYPRLP